MKKNLFFGLALAALSALAMPAVAQSGTLPATTDQSKPVMAPATAQPTPAGQVAPATAHQLDADVDAPAKRVRTDKMHQKQEHHARRVNRATKKEGKAAGRSLDAKVGG